MERIESKPSLTKQNASLRAGAQETDNTVKKGMGLRREVVVKDALRPWVNTNADSVAGYQALSPLTFIRWSAEVYPEHLAVVYGERFYNWKQCYERCLRLASALRKKGIRTGDTVSIMAANTPELYEAHFGIPMAGAVLNTLNTRLDPDTIAYCLEHSQAKALVIDTQFSERMGSGLDKLKRGILIIDVVDKAIPQAGQQIGEIDYEAFLNTGNESFVYEEPVDEWNTISINYASGASKDPRPKGVLHHHRGAYLGAIGNVLCWELVRHPIYLWTLPMYHSNGWGFPWTIAAVAGTNICLRHYTGSVIWEAVSHHRVTHFCGAPIVLDMVSSVPQPERPRVNHKVKVMTGGSAPSPKTLEEVTRAGFEVLHAYGLAETQGPAAVCAWQEAWRSFGIEEQSVLASRQGKRSPVVADLVVVDDENHKVPANALTQGEILVRGNTIMQGYLNDSAATSEALSDSYLHTRDVAVVHKDGYIQVKQRRKDIIKSGGETISCLEVEHVISQHEAVNQVFVVARPDRVWGESPCAFVVLKEATKDVKAEDIIHFCRERLAHYKCPTRVVLGEIPLTGLTESGKVRRNVLKKKAEEIP